MNDRFIKSNGMERQQQASCRIRSRLDISRRGIWKRETGNYRHTVGNVSFSLALAYPKRNYPRSAVKSADLRDLFEGCSRRQLPLGNGYFARKKIVLDGVYLRLSANFHFTKATYEAGICVGTCNYPPQEYLAIKEEDRGNVARRAEGPSGYTGWQLARTIGIRRPLFLGSRWVPPGSCHSRGQVYVF